MGKQEPGAARRVSGPMTRRRLTSIGVLVAAIALSTGPIPRTAVRTAVAASPIEHIVIIDQENHSFDNVLGRFCRQVVVGTITRAGLNQSCDGVTQGATHTGEIIPLPAAADISPNIPHSVAAHQIAINGGAMDGFDLLNGCSADRNYGCYQAYTPEQSPNLTTFARDYALGDAFFEFAWFSSWMSHTSMVTLDMDGFQGNIPKSTQSTTTGRGWGCDSKLDAKWSPTGLPPYTNQPACIPDATGAGPYRASQVPHVPTLMDRMQEAGVSWKIFGSGGPGGGGAYGWTICPTFWSCLGHPEQKANFKSASAFLTSAANHTLPQVSIVTPLGKNSQHNSTSWTQGDNWLGSLVAAIRDNGYWDSTAIVITWDDCGCFYDHVPPPVAGLGIRLPMVILGPYVKAGYTESTVTTWSNLAALVETTFGVAPINSRDAGAYAFQDVFDLGQAPLPPPATVTTALPATSTTFLRTHPYFCPTKQEGGKASTTPCTG